jgi:uncharacterized protein (DUF1501 family)
MLTFWGAGRRFCDRLTRRDFLGVGALGAGGLSLADVLRLRAQAPTGTRPRSVIMVCLAGGPSHLDTYDPKPGAPADYRGEFRPIKTRVPGFDLCEHLPRQARLTDRLALVRTVQFVEPMQHELQEVYTGFPKSARRPAFGAVVSRFQPGGARVPRYVSLDQYYADHAQLEDPQYVGTAHRPFLFGSEGVRNLGLAPGVSLDRLADRKELARTFDSLRRDLDTRAEAGALDSFTAQALDLVTSARAREAFDLSREDPRSRDRYGTPNDRYIYIGREANSPWEGHKFLLARRLVEAGVSVVTMRIASWDHHGNVLSSAGGNIFLSLRTALPLLDRSLSALVEDLHDRGLDREVVVLVWGEFGRTPKIVQGGRDHWPQVGFALFAGAVRTGVVVGETDSKGELPRSRGVGAPNVLGTVYHALGIDPKALIPDFTGRPVPLLDDGDPIPELVG